MNQESDFWIVIHEQVAILQGAFPIPEKWKCSFRKKKKSKIFDKTR